MLPRRIATFLIGAWLGCSVLIAALVLRNPSFANVMATNPGEGARQLVEKLGADDAGILLRHFANEQSRQYLSNWEVTQLVLTLVMIVLLVFSGQKWMKLAILTLIMCGLVLFQHFGITPELIFYGRQADFVRAEASYSLESQLWTLTRTYGVAEAVKLICGGILASLLFVAQANVKPRQGPRRSEATATHTAA